MANILEEVVQYQYQDQVLLAEGQEGEGDSPVTDRSSQGTESIPSSTSVTVSNVPQQTMLHFTEVDSVGRAIMRQVNHERDVQVVDMSGIEKRLEDAMRREWTWWKEARRGGQARE